jgi:hypothetical protein
MIPRLAGMNVKRGRRNQRFAAIGDAVGYAQAFERATDGSKSLTPAS